MVRPSERQILRELRWQFGGKDFILDRRRRLIREKGNSSDDGIGKATSICWGWLVKAHISGHWRTSPKGKRYYVPAHEDRRMRRVARPSGEGMGDLFSQPEPETREPDTWPAPSPEAARFQAGGREARLPEKSNPPPTLEKEPPPASAEEPAWKMSASRYQSIKGVPQPWIGEISEVQFTRMGKQQKSAYEKKRSSEWQASADVKEEWAKKVREAYDRGEFDLEHPDLHRYARSHILWSVSREKEKREKEQAEQENSITSPNDLKVGEAYYHAVYGMGKLLRVSPKSVTLEGSRGNFKVRWQDLKRRSPYGEGQPTAAQDRDPSAISPEAQRYIHRIKNPKKKDYAQRWAAWKASGENGEEPERGELGVMGAQAVRIELTPFFKALPLRWGWILQKGHRKGHWRTLHGTGRKVWVKDTTTRVEAAPHHKLIVWQRRSEQVAPGGGRRERTQALKPELSADVARLWTLETLSTYKSSDYSVLAVREGMQNSIDAIRTAQKRGQVPATGGHYDVTLDTAGKWLRMEDNGTGMDMDTLLSKFLTLGGTGKGVEGGVTGGFGVAKAVILGASETGDWTIHTQDNLLHSSQLGQDLPESEFKTEARKGTSLTVRGLGNFREWKVLTDAKLVMEASDIPGISCTLNGEVVKPIFGNKKGTRLTNFESKWGQGTQAKITSYKRKDGSSGAIYVRLNGLYQWHTTFWENVPKDIVIDLTTDARPGSEEYPFTKGRDGFRGEAADRFSELRDMVQQESLSITRENKWETTLYDAAKKAPVSQEMPLDLYALESFLYDHKKPGLSLSWEHTYVRVHDLETHRATDFRYDEPNDLRQIPLLMQWDKPTTDTWKKLVRLDKPEEEAPEGGAVLPGGTVLSKDLVSSVKEINRLNEELRAAEEETYRQTIQKEKPEKRGVESVPAPETYSGLSQGKGAGRSMADRMMEAITAGPSGSEEEGIRQGGETAAPVSAPWLVKRNNATYGKRKKFDPLKNLDLLLAWDATCNLVAEAYGRERISLSSFGSGFVLDPDARALATTEDDSDLPESQFVLLNPDMARENLKAAQKSQNSMSMAGYLHTLACHELAHLSGMSSGHNEQFSSRREEIGLKTASVLPAIQKVVEATLMRPKTPREKKVAREGQVKLEGLLEERKEKGRRRKVREALRDQLSLF